MSVRDEIDFGTVKVSRLFAKLFIPTLLGMVSWAMLTVVDGVFVGWGVGSHGIAAINICYPIFIVLTGFALMMGAGVSVVASIHLSQKNVKAARINVTQAIGFASFLVLLVVLVIEAFPEWMARLLGASDTLASHVVDYMVWLMPSAVTQMWSVIGLFVIRLDGSPKYAMWCNVVPATLNMLLDWLFIYPLGMAVKGAAIASSISTMVGGLMAISYLLFISKKLNLYPLKATMMGLRQTLRNVLYQCKIGFSAFVGEVAMAMLMIVGNIVFMKYQGDAGVGAYGVACYYLPFVFMFGGSIAQSLQPIASYNFGLGRNDRVVEAFAISCRTGVLASLFSIIAFTMFARYLVTLFIDGNDPAADIAIAGFPYFAVGFLFYITNLVAIGFLQSIKRVAPSVLFSFLRGMIFLIPSYCIMPQIFGIKGIWLAMPVSEIATFLVVVVYMAINRRKLF